LAIELALSDSSDSRLDILDSLCFLLLSSWSSYYLRLARNVFYLGAILVLFAYPKKEDLFAVWLLLGLQSEMKDDVI